MLDITKVDRETLLNAPKSDLIKLAKNLAALQARAGQVGPQNDDELHELIKRHYKMHIPRVAVTPGHDAPFDFVADAFFQRETSQFVIANREGAKCVRWDSLVHDPLTGLVRTIEQVVFGHPEWHVSCVTADGRLTQSLPTHRWDRGSKETLEIETASGRSIAVTPEHPLLTPEGYRRADSLSVGDDLASLTHIPGPAAPVWMTGLSIDLLAILLSEGSYTGSGVKFSSADDRIVKKVRAAANAMQCDIFRDSEYDWRISKRIGVGLRNPVRVWMESLGLGNEKATEKKIPDAVFRLSNDQLAHFLGVFWMCDGFVTKKEAAVTLASDEMIRQIQHLLLRGGVQSRVKRSMYKSSDGREFLATRLVVYGGESTSKFAQWIGPHLWGHKLEAIKKLAAKPRLEKSGRPKITSALIAKMQADMPRAKRGSAGPVRSLWESLGWDPDSVDRPSAAPKTVMCRGGLKTVSRKRLRALIDYHQCAIRPYELYLSEDIWWDPIVSIRSAGVQRVYDLTVDPHSNFVAEGLVCHNTSNVALLHALMARFYPGYEGITAGAIEIQAKRCYTNFKKFLNQWGKEQLEAPPLQSETLYTNGSKVEIITGCLPPYAKVITEQGEMRIGTIVANRLPVKVKSYNFDSQQWEWKPVTGWYNNGRTEKWMRVKLKIGRQGKTHLCATSGHSVYQPDGTKKMLGEFVAGEEMCVPGERLSEQQEQVLIGKMLGDGHVNATGVVCFDHSNNQLDYLHWQYAAFEEFALGWAERASKGTTSFRLKCIRRFHELRDEWYQDDVKRIPPSVWSKIDTLGLAVWLMDDGGWSPGSGGQWTISCHHFNSAERLRMAFFFNYLGVDGTWACVDAEKDQWIWRTVGQGGQILLGLVADHIDVSTRQARGYKRWVSTTKVEPSSEALLPAVIESITEHLVTDSTNQTRYDITVADNHNYCVGSGILISNTLAGMNGPHGNLLHRDEVELFRRDAFNEGDNITKSGMLSDGRQIKAHDILTSTRKKARGLVQEILDECEQAEKIGSRPPYRVYKWGVAETIQRVPNCRGLPENADLPDDQLCPCNKIVNGYWDAEATEPRTLESVCDGRFGKSDGWRPLDPDIISKFTKNSRPMWEAQQECMKVASEGLILENFSRELHGVADYDFDPANGKIYLGVDFGGRNPHAANWYQLLDHPVTVTCYAPGVEDPPTRVLQAGTLVCFGEIYITEIGNVELARMVVDRETQYKLRYSMFQVDERYADVAAKSARLDWAQHIPKLKTEWRITREIDEHIKLCQELVNNRLFAVDVGQCPNFCAEAEAWQRDPETQKQVDEFNHAMSAFRYVVAHVHRISMRKQRLAHSAQANRPIARTANDAKPPVSENLDVSKSPKAGPSRSLNDDPYGIPMHQGPSSGRPSRMW